MSEKSDEKSPNVLDLCPFREQQVPHNLYIYFSKPCAIKI